MSFGISMVYWIALHRHPPVRVFGIWVDILEVDIYIFNDSRGSKGVAPCEVALDVLFYTGQVEIRGLTKQE